MAGRFIWYRIRNATVVLLAVAALLATAAPARAQSEYVIESGSNPPFELGFGLSLMRHQSRPEWTGKYMWSFFPMASIRLLYGLSIVGMADIGRGQEPYPDWIPYEDDILAKTTSGTFLESLSIGFRYDIPVRYFRRDLWGIDQICPSAGYMTTNYGVVGNQLYDQSQPEGERFIDFDSSQTFMTAEADAIYVGIAARWRIATDVTGNVDSWFGSYGVEAGARYIRYIDSTLHSRQVQPTKDNFNTYQFYVAGFMKFKLFY